MTGRRAKVLLGVAVGALAISLSACIGGGAAPGGSSGPDGSTAPSPTPAETRIPSGPSSTTRSDDAFELTISTPKARVAPDEAIQVDTTLTYIGSKPKADVSGAAGGPVAFSLQEVDGERTAGPVVDTACVSRPMTRNAPVAQPFQKSGAWSEGDPNADFVRDYVRGSELRLPVGHWRITAHLTAYVGTCTATGAHELTASVEIAVR